MTPSFHDGYLIGVVLREPKMVHLYLKTVDGNQYMLVCRGLERLRVTNFFEANIVLDIEVLEAEQLNEFYIERLYELSPVDAAGQTAKLLGLVRRQSLRMVVVSSSYGAECLALVENWSLEVRKRRLEMVRKRFYLPTAQAAL